MDNQSKPWWQSKSVIGGLVALLAVVLKGFGYDFGLENQQVIIDTLLEVVSGAGAALAVYGRVKATKKLTTKKG